MFPVCDGDLPSSGVCGFTRPAPRTSSSWWTSWNGSRVSGPVERPRRWRWRCGCRWRSREEIGRFSSIVCYLLTFSSCIWGVGSNCVGTRMKIRGSWYIDGCSVPPDVISTMGLDLCLYRMGMSQYHDHRTGYCFRWGCHLLLLGQWRKLQLKYHPILEVPQV